MYTSFSFRFHGLKTDPLRFQVNERSGLPLRSVLLCTLITALIGIINVGSTVAFNAIVSLTMAGLFTSYMIPIILLVLKRVKGEEIPFGPWRMGPLGIFVNLASIGFLAISIVFGFFPPSLPVTPANMNWSIVVFGGELLIGLVYYAVRGRVVYTGPIVETPIVLTQSGEEQSRA